MRGAAASSHVDAPDAAEYHRAHATAGKGRSARYAGIAAFPIGGAAVAGGMLLMIVVAIFDAQHGSPDQGPSGMLVGGGITAGGGLALIALGVVAVVTTPPTRYEFSRLRPGPGGFAVAF